MRYLLLLVFSVFSLSVFGQCTFTTYAEVDTPSSCTVCNGTLDIQPMSGTPPFSYSWSNGATASVLSNLCVAKYTVVITDGAGCIKKDTFDFTETRTVNTYAEVDDPTSCFACNGSLDVQPTAGRPPFTYSWSNGGTTGVMSGLCVGRYTLLLTDNNGCTKRDTFYLDAPLAATVNVLQSVSCNSGNNGSLAAHGTCGMPFTTGLPYQYKWYRLNGSTPVLLAGQTDSIATNLSAGTYFSILTGADSDTEQTANIILPEPAAIILNPVAVTPASCGGGADGSVSISANGPNPPFTFAIGNGTYSNTNNFAGLAAGGYIFHIKNANGCIKDTTIIVPGSSAISVTATVTQPTCSGSNSGSVTLIASGGSGTYTYAINAGTYTTTNSFTSLGGGSYNFHVKDATGCIKDTVIVLSGGSSLTISANTTNISCFGDSSGVVTLTAGGGVAPYTYAKDAGIYGTSGTFSGLAAGNYTFYAKDANGCTTSIPGTVSQSARIVPAAFVTNIACSGGSTGSVALSATGGQGNFTYAQGAGSYQAGGSFTGLAAGTYLFHVKDGAGCIRDTTIIINQSAGIVPAASATHVSCFGNNNGAVSISATGGTIPYTYAKDAGTYGSSGSFNTLTSGTYVFHIKDAAGCIRDTTINITQPSQIVPAASVTSVSCNGGSGGSVILSATGGTGAFSFAQGAGAYVASGVFGSLTAGTYTFHVKDAAGCIRDTVLTVTQPTAVAINTVVTQVNCFDGNTGSVAITASGGTPGYTFARDAGTYSASNNFNNLAAGTYIFHIKDAAACIKDTTIVISQPSRIMPAAAVTAVTCSGATSGSVTITATGGTGSAYTFARDAGVYSNIGTFGALNAGSYVFHVKDAAGCIRDTTINVTQPSQIVPAASVTPVSCNSAATGSVTLSATGGTGAFSYALSAGTYVASGMFGGLTAGVYTFHVKDAAGCVRDTILTITQPTAINVTSVVTQVSCFGGSTGSVSLSVSGGTPGYTFARDAGSFSSVNSFNALPAGTYIFHIKDAATCIKDTTISITQPSRIILAAAVTDVSCYGTATGSVIISAIGGTGAYTFARDAGVYGGSGTFATLIAGSYVFHVKDAAGCIRDTTINVTQASQIVPSASLTFVSCNGGSTGSVTLSATGGTGAFSYAQGTGAYATSGVFGGLTAGIYTFHVKDAAGCVRDTVLTMTEPPLLTLSLIATPVSCYGGANGGITSTTAGGTLPYSYLWTNGNTANSLSSVLAGVYGLTVTDAKGCTASGTATVISPDSIQLPAVITAPFCYGFCDGGIVLSPVGGTVPYSYSWSNGSTTKDISNLCAGNYTITLTDDHSCTATATYTLVNPAPVTVNLGPDRLLCNTGTLTLSPSSSDTDAAFHWTSSIAGFSADTATLVVRQSGTYYVTATARGCNGKDTVVIGQTNDDFNAEFVASTQAFKDSVFSIVNISSPEPDSVAWGLPSTPNVVIVSRSKYLAELIFRDTGVYTITMIGRSGQCEKMVQDRVVVIAGQPYTPIAGTTKRSHIKAFTIAPNPSNGRFDVHIELEEDGPVRLRLLSLTSSGAADDRQDSGKKLYNFSYNLNVQSGQYLLLLETGLGSQSLKLVIQ